VTTAMGSSAPETLCSPFSKRNSQILFGIGCICHLKNLCVAVGMKMLAISVNDFVVYIYFLFDQSVKRKGDFEEFTDAEHK